MTDAAPDRKRFMIFVSLLSLLALVVLVHYGTFMFNPPADDAVNQSGSSTERGAILDRNGRILALQTRLGNISVWRPEITNLQAVCDELAPVLDMDAAELRGRIANASTDFIYLKKQVDQSTVKIIEAARSEGKLRGVNIEHIQGRVYPEQRLAGQLVGFVGSDNRGLAGIEYAFEKDLAAGSGTAIGNQVILTIDTTVQHILEEIAERTRIDTQAEAVMLMAMDPRTGDVLGAASLPDFDPNDINASDELSRMDRPAIWAYEPGSVFKVYSLAALMDSGAIDGKTVFNCNGHYEHVTNLGEKVTINCLSAHGPVTAREIIIYSCNAGAAYAADQLGAGAFYDLLRDFGFGARTGAGNPGETAGFLRNYGYWSERSKPTIAMGQEIAVSAMQMLQAASAIANDGILVPPRVVSRIVSAEGKTVRTYGTAIPRRILSAQTAQAMRSYMVDVTSDIGTGWRANVADLSLAVKTGTAQMIDARTGGYSDTDFIASCIALLPAENPSLIIYIAIIKPRTEFLGGRIAAPPIREAAEALVDYLGIPRGRNPQVSHSGSLSLPVTDIPQVDSYVPDFSGYSKRELAPLFLRDDLTIEMTGDGWVRRQSPEPGTPMAPDTVITLELE
ncbi:penicillin-binding protein [Spirochaetia bacterium]|nr:penicillin-binding protein [Spirochaetia bacterium]